MSPARQEDPRVAGLASWARGEPAAPYSLDISPTDWCNLKCHTCWMRNPVFKEEFRSEYQLSDARLLSLIGEAAELGVRHVELTGGGEPMLRRDVVLEMMSRVKQYGMLGSMTTNGTLFDSESVHRIVRLGWDRLVFSVDGPDRETNDWLRPRKTAGEGEESPFGRIVEALIAFQREKSAQGSALPMVALNTVLSRRNAAEVSRMVRFAARHGVGRVSFEPLTTHSALGAELRLSPEDVRAMQPEVREAARMAAELGVETNIGKYAEHALVTGKNALPEVYAADVLARSGFLGIPCYEPWFHLVVKTDGSVGPCCVFEDKAVSVKEHSLREIWTGAFLSKVRASMASREFLPWCRTCNAGQLLQNRALREDLGHAMRVVA